MKNNYVRFGMSIGAIHKLEDPGECASSICEERAMFHITVGEKNIELCEKCFRFISEYSAETLVNYEKGIYDGFLKKE